MRSSEALENCPKWGRGVGGGVKRGEEVAQGGQLTLLIKLEGGRGRGAGQTCPVSNCIHGVCSFPFHLSFSYLRSAVEASLDMKKFHMERNNLHKDTAETETEVAEKSSWDQANRGQKIGLVWRN